MPVQQPAINVLKEIQMFLQANPSEVITIFIEDYVTSPMGLTRVFNASGLMKYWFPVSRMPKNGENWPLLSDMITRNLRLLVFTSKSSKEASEQIAYEWRYVVENQCGKELVFNLFIYLFFIISCIAIICSQLCFKFCRWRWRNEIGLLPEPRWVFAYELIIKITCSNELLPLAS